MAINPSGLTDGFVQGFTLVNNYKQQQLQNRRAEQEAAAQAARQMKEDERQARLDARQERLDSLNKIKIEDDLLTNEQRRAQSAKEFEYETGAGRKLREEQIRASIQSSRAAAAAANRRNPADERTPADTVEALRRLKAQMLTLRKVPPEVLAPVVKGFQTGNFQGVTPEAIKEAGKVVLAPYMSRGTQEPINPETAKRNRIPQGSIIVAKEPLQIYRADSEKGFAAELQVTAVDPKTKKEYKYIAPFTMKGSSDDDDPPAIIKDEKLGDAIRGSTYTMQLLDQLRDRDGIDLRGVPDEEAAALVDQLISTLMPPKNMSVSGGYIGPDGQFVQTDMSPEQRAYLNTIRDDPEATAAFLGLAPPSPVSPAEGGGNRVITDRQYSKSRDQTRIIYSDGTTEVVSGDQRGK